MLVWPWWRRVLIARRALVLAASCAGTAWVAAGEEAGSWRTATISDLARGGAPTVHRAVPAGRVEWRDHQVSREYLGYPETARQLEIRLSRCHPTNRPAVSADLAAAREERGTTVFDWLIGIFEGRTPGVLRLQ
ncbi:barstar family protein [Streptomyces sp. NPDC004393]